jgi:hypothetical protein
MQKYRQQKPLLCQLIFNNKTMRKLLIIILSISSLVSKGQVVSGSFSGEAGAHRWITYTIEKDTLEVPKEIHFIKIDGEVYEIKRKTELKKIEPQVKKFDLQPNLLTPYYQTTPIICDTASFAPNSSLLNFTTTPLPVESFNAGDVLIYDSNGGAFKPYKPFGASNPNKKKKK